MCRAMTVEEMRAAFMRYAVEMTKDSARFPTAKIRKDFNLPDADIPSGVIEAYMQHAAKGVLFGLLVALDGEIGGLPAFDLIPIPHEEDEAYCKSEGENWWMPVVINTSSLHGDLHKYKGK